MKGVSRGLQGPLKPSALKGASRGLEGLKGASRGLEGGFTLKGASRGLEGGFKGASREHEAFSAEGGFEDA